MLRFLLQFLQQRRDGFREPGINKTRTGGKPIVGNIVSSHRYWRIAKPYRKLVWRVRAGTAPDVKFHTYHTRVHRLPHSKNKHVLHGVVHYRCVIIVRCGHKTAWTWRQAAILCLSNC